MVFVRLIYQLVDIAVFCTGVILTIRFIVLFLALLHISATSVGFEGSLQNVWELIGLHFGQSQACSIRWSPVFVQSCVSIC